MIPFFGTRITEVNLLIINKRLIWICDWGKMRGFRKSSQSFDAIMLSENTSWIVKQCFTLGVIRTVAFNILPIESLDSLPSGAEWNWWPESLAVNILRISLVVKENKCGTNKLISLICCVVVLWSWFFWKQPLSSCLQQSLYRDSVMTITTFHM